MRKINITVFSAIIALLLMFTGTVQAAAEQAGAADYDGKRMGIITGTNFEAPTLELFPNSEYFYYNSYTDVAAALTNNKIDGFLGDEPTLKVMTTEIPAMTVLPELLTKDDYAFAFGKNSERADKIRGQFNELLAELLSDGGLDEICAKWFGDDESVKFVDLETGYSGENGKLNVVTTATDLPFSYVKDNKNVGVCMEIVELFCRRYGYTPVINDVDFNARIPGLVSGKFDMCASSMTITEERKESVNFSEPFYHGGIVLAVRASDLDGIPDVADKSNAGVSKTSGNNFAAAEQGNVAESFTGKRIGVQTGTISGQLAEKNYPNAQVNYFETETDVLTALKTGKVDAWITDEPVLRFMQIENPELQILDGYLAESNLAAVFPKTEDGQALCDQFSAFVDSLWADGTMKEIDAVWFGLDDSKRTVLDYEQLPAPNGKLRMAADLMHPPFAYMKDGRAIGYDLDVVARFCQEYGYGLEIVSMSFGGILPAVQSGKVDFAASNITVTAERAETVLFSTPDYYGGIAMAVRKSEDTSAVTANDTYTSLAQLDGKRIGVQTGTISGRLAEKRYPNAQVNYFETATDALTALKTGKVDAWVTDEPVIRFAQIENPELQLLDGYLAESNLAAVFPKTEAGQALCDQYSTFVDSLWADGTMEEIDAVWFSTDDAKRTVLSYEQLPATNGKLRMAADLMHPPFAYMKDGRAIGYDVDVAARFCQKYGYGLEVVSMSFGGILPAVQSGKVDFAASSITVTAERAEAVLFSTPDYYGGVAMAVRKSEDTPASTANDAYTSLAQLDGKRIGVQTGQSFDAMIMAKLPNATISYVNSKADLINALMTHKIDSYAVDEPVVKFQVQENDRLTYIPEYLDTFEFGYVFAKNENGQALQSQFNEYLKTIADNGTLQEIENRWFSLDDSQKVMPDYASFPAENGTLRMATEALYQPFSYILNGKVVGYDIDIAVRFCQTYGYGLEITDMSFDGILPSVQSGKADFGCAGITITPERAESVLFSDPNYAGGTVMAVLKAESAAEQAQPTAAASEAAAEPSFLDGIVSSFNKTFIREARWKLFAEGVVTTMLITLLSILFGTALGFLLFLWCRNGNPAANLITRFSMWLVQGMPMVVLLMILYYVVFGSVAISGVAVAVIGFTLTFGASVFGLLKMGVGAVDNGQYEAAYALGYSNRRTFFKIILPQALPHVLSAYRGEIVSLIKATAIVGYIAVQDLTKMGDIVRSRTYEAFFPLIAVTIIYFVLEGLVGYLVSRISVSFNPKRRKSTDILMGVKTDDKN